MGEETGAAPSRHGRGSGRVRGLRQCRPALYRRPLRETRVGILLVEQNAKQSLAIADRGYLLEKGRITGEDSAANLADDPSVQAAYLGVASPA